MIGIVSEISVFVQMLAHLHGCVINDSDAAYLNGYIQTR